MKTDIKIFLVLLLIVLGLIFLIQEFYIPIKSVQYKYSPTDFIEPNENFLKCFEDTDCIKVKGSACPPESGGTEVCVDKDHFQEYISEIEKQAGRESEVTCPEIYLLSNKTCSCIESKCELA
jgi:hypothetical protein